MLRTPKISPLVGANFYSVFEKSLFWIRNCNSEYDLQILKDFMSPFLGKIFQAVAIAIKNPARYIFKLMRKNFRVLYFMKMFDESFF